MINNNYGRVRVAREEESRGQRGRVWDVLPGVNRSQSVQNVPWTVLIVVLGI